MRCLLAAVLPLFLTAAAASPAWADGPLAPGKAAGIKTAQSETQINKLAIIGAVAIVAVSAYLIAGTHYHVPKSGTQPASGTN